MTAQYKRVDKMKEELDALRKYRDTLPAVFKFNRQEPVARNQEDHVSIPLEPEAMNEITVRLDPDIDERLTRLVEEYGHNKQYYLIELARNGIEALENALEADRVVMLSRLKGEKMIPLEDIMRKYDIQD
jgi:predicted DNA-binding protein